MKQPTFDRFQFTRAQFDESNGSLQAALDNLINSSDLNDERYVIDAVGTLAKLRAVRAEAWSDYLLAEEQLIRELNEGLFPGEHRSS